MSSSMTGTAIETIVSTYLDLRDSEEETFLEAFRRVGMTPFKEKLYPEGKSGEARNAA